MILEKTQNEYFHSNTHGEVGVQKCMDNQRNWREWVDQVRWLRYSYVYADISWNDKCIAHRCLFNLKHNIHMLTYFFHHIRDHDLCLTRTTYISPGQCRNGLCNFSPVTRYVLTGQNCSNSYRKHPSNSNPNIIHFSFLRQ